MATISTLKSSNGAISLKFMSRPAWSMQTAGANNALSAQQQEDEGCRIEEINMLKETVSSHSPPISSPCRTALGISVAPAGGDELYSRRQVLRILGPFFIAFLLVVAYSASRGFSFSKDDTATTLTSLDQNKSTEVEFGVYGFEVVNSFYHDPQAFTQVQGLVYAGNNTFYESTGLYGRSSVREVRVQTGLVVKHFEMNKDDFGEGLTLFDRRLFQVAWRVTSGFVYDADTLRPLKSFKHPMKDGWGLATDGRSIYGSDGTSTIYVMQPFTFAEERRFIVKDEERPIAALNELEYVDNELWANVWMKDCIVRISPKDGRVLGWILLHDLSESVRQANERTDVLNGIAWDRMDNRIYVTGKLWPKVYEIKVHPHSENFQNRKDIWQRCRL